MKSCCILLGLVIFSGATPFPIHARAVPQSKGCEGSTVDLLGPGLAKKYRAFLADLKTAVRNGNETAIASMISYPLLFIHGSRKTHIREKAAFLSSYKTIFTQYVRQMIAQQSEKCLFGNDQGAMVGNGQVWFTELKDGSVEIITVNTTAPANREATERKARGRRALTAATHAIPTKRPRTPKTRFALLGAEGSDGVHFCRPAGRQVARERGDGNEAERDTYIRNGVGRPYPEEQ
jgi:hypothetical protein